MVQPGKSLWPQPVNVSWPPPLEMEMPSTFLKWPRWFRLSLSFASGRAIMAKVRTAAATKTAVTHTAFMLLIMITSLAMPAGRQYGTPFPANTCSCFFVE